MGISYKLRLCFGYEVKEEAAFAPFLKTHTEVKEGVFHMEDRFDPKTGDKVEPEKVWDIKPSKKVTKWVEIGGVRIEDYNALELISQLEDYYECNVETFGSFVSSNAKTLVFYVNEPVLWKDASDYGKFSVYNNSLSLEEISKLTPKVLSLKEKLEANNIKVNEPKCFLAILEG